MAAHLRSQGWLVVAPDVVEKAGTLDFSKLRSEVTQAEFDALPVYGPEAPENVIRWRREIEMSGSSRVTHWFYQRTKDGKVHVRPLVIV